MSASQLEAELNKYNNEDRKRLFEEYWEPKLSEISDLYNNKIMNQKQIAEKFGVHQSTISKLFVRYGIAKRNRTSKYNNIFEDGLVENICEHCGKKFNTYSSSQRKYCSVECWQAVHTYEKKTIKICRYCGKNFEVYKSDIEREGKGVYCSKTCQLKDAEQANVTTTCMNCGKEIKTIKSRVRGGRGKFCSRGCAGVWKVLSGEFDYNMKRNSKSGKREDLDNQYFRSAWEANYARYLNWLIKQGEIKAWEFEVDTFQFPVKRGNMSYLPDFKITNNDGSIEYHEVKGYMDDNSRVKLNRMAKYYPEVKLVLIDKEFYVALAKQMKPMIVGWE